MKESAGLSHDDGKRPGGVTLLPWAQGKPLAWDVTVLDTYADSHLADTATTAAAAADKAASNEVARYRQIANSHIFVPVGVESAGTWNHQAVERRCGLQYFTLGNLVLDKKPYPRRGHSKLRLQCDTEVYCTVLTNTVMIKAKF